MSKSPDQNDQHVAGKLDPDPVAQIRPKPMNKQAEVVDIKAKREAERKAADAARILTVREILETSARRSKSEDRARACTTGHYQLDDATGGIMPGKSWLFGAESSWGKSSWLVSVTDENLRIGKKVLIVSAEDDEETYGDRLLARRSRVRARTIRKGDYDEEDQAAVDAVIRNAENLPVFLDARGRSCEWTARKVDELLEKEDIDLVAYDYIQEWTADNREENHRLTVKYIGATLRKVVSKRKKASIVFSQLTVDDKESKTMIYPNRRMIRDCRDLANAATVILLGYTPSKAITDGDSPGANVIVPAGARAIFVDKVKNGPRGFAVHTEWDDSTASFVKMEKPRKKNDEGPPPDDPRFL